MTSFNLFDILVALIIVMGIWTGVRKGGVREITRILGLVLAFALGIQLMKPVGLIVVSSLNLSEQLASIVGFIIVFLGISIAVTLVAKVLETIVSTLMLGPVDKLLGGAVGGLKAALLLSIGLMLVGGSGYPGQQTRDTSKLYEPVEQIAPATWKVVSLVLPEAQRLTGDVGNRFQEVITKQVNGDVPTQ